MKYNSYFIISSQWILKPVLRVKNKFWLKFCSYHADEYGRTVEMIISSSFFFYYVKFIIYQLSVMQNKFKYGVSCIGIINKYALLSELDKGIIQSWPMGALPSQTLNLLTILFSMLFWWRSENSATVQDSMAFLPIMRKGHFGEWLWCSALKIKKKNLFNNYQ